MLNSKLFEFSYNSIIDGLFKKNKKVSREEVSKKKKKIDAENKPENRERKREREKETKQNKTKGSKGTMSQPLCSARETQTHL